MRASEIPTAEQACGVERGRCSCCAWRWLAIWTVFAGAAVFLSQAFLDVPVMQWSNWAGLRQARDGFQYVSHLGDSTWYLASLVVLTPLAFVIGRRLLARRLLFILAALVVSGLLVQALKIVAGRYRPKVMIDDGLYGFTWFDYGYETASFPSGHTATIAVIAASLWILFPKWRDLWVIPIIAVAAARMIVGSHYLSDVIAGAFVGAATTFIVYRLMRWSGVLGSTAPRSRPMTASVGQSRFE